MLILLVAGILVVMVLYVLFRELAGPALVLLAVGWVVMHFQHQPDAAPRNAGYAAKSDASR